MHEVVVKGILSAKNGMNIYRGCTHGCIYCDSRSTCYQILHTFEDIEVKKNAVELLEQTLRKKKKKVMIGTGSMCDPYMDIELSTKIMRKSLQLILDYGFGATVLTKSANVLRDLDLLKKINENTKSVVQITLTTFDENLCRLIEPNVSTTKERIEVLKIMKENNIPTVVWLSPILPYINDTRENIEAIMNACIATEVRGILCFGIGLTLREGNREYFYKKLDESFPGIKEKYINKFGNSYELQSENQKELMDYLKETSKKHGILFGPDACFSYLHEFEDKNLYEQIRLPGM